MKTREGTPRVFGSILHRPKASGTLRRQVRQKLSWVLCAVVLTRCAGVSPQDTALLVTVVLDPGAMSKCVKVQLQPGSAEAQTSQPMVVGGRSRLTVAIRRGTLPATVEVQAVGYGDDACATPTAPAEVSGRLTTAFSTAKTPIELHLKRGTVDADRDGFNSIASGGTDCDDQNELVKPGVTELCSNGLDDNCDNLTDCADLPRCANAACAMGALCTGGRCREQNCGDNVDNNLDGGTDCQDADCLGQMCGNGIRCAPTGLCAFLPNEIAHCDNGTDDDGDGETDCADSDCQGGGCLGTDACRVGMTCNNKQCQGGIAKVCDMPPSTCLGGQGRCVSPAGVCVYDPAPAPVCSDNLKCTQSDTCLADGGCTGSAVVCNTPPNGGMCFEAVGQCNAADGGCGYTVTQNDNCTDSNDCTMGDLCAADGTCTGTAVVCPAPAGECLVSAGCQHPGGTCLEQPKAPGTACTGGVCFGDGGCGTIFPYTPANFTEGQLLGVAPTRADVVLNCSATLNTGSLAVTAPASVTLCGVQIPTGAVDQPSGTQALLLGTHAFTVGDGGVITVVGERPLIIGATGPVMIRGALMLAGQGTTPGAGGNSGCSLGVGNPGGVGVASGTSGDDAVISCGGGGGAGFGTVGADGGSATEPNGAAGGARGLALSGAELSPLRGGCEGGRGGHCGPAVEPLLGGPGGPGGGALQISSAMGLTVTGLISASGGGGS